MPAFTSSALKQRGIAGAVRASPGMTPLAIGAMVVVTLADLFIPDGPVAGTIALIAAAVQLARLLQWRTRRTLREPIV